MDVSGIINRHGEIDKAFTEVLIELGILEYQRITEADEIDIGRADFVYLCAETSPEILLGAEKNS